MEPISGIHEICVDKTSCKHKDSLTRQATDEKLLNNTKDKQEQNAQINNNLPS